MKACFLVSEFSRSGGVAVLKDHAERLAGNGIETELVVTSDPRSVDKALATDYDVAISTWWETASLLWRLRVGRRIAFLQSAEECFYRGSEAADRLGAALSMRAADEYLVVSHWLADLVRGVRPGAPVRLVPNGIDKEVFDGTRTERGGERLRVLVEGQPSVWFKGVEAAVAAVRAADVPVELTVVSPEAADVVDADTVVSGLQPPEMAKLYAETDLVVKLSRLEGLGLVPLEAFHHGVPCIVTPYGGHADYVRHGTNGFIVGFDDPQTVTRYVELISRDGALWGRLSEGALTTADEWPDAARSSALFAEALEARESAMDAPVAPMLDAWRLAAEQDRGWRASWQEVTLAETRAALEERIAEAERLNAHAAELEYSRLHIAAELEKVRSTRAYRAAVAARSVIDRVRR